MGKTVRILGLDPGLRHTGWAVVDSCDSRLSFVAAGVADSTDALSLAERLAELHGQIRTVVSDFSPDEAAVEETFVNKIRIRHLSWGRRAALFCWRRLRREYR